MVEFLQRKQIFWKLTQQKGLDVLHTLLNCRWIFFFLLFFFSGIWYYKDNCFWVAIVAQWVMWLLGFFFSVQSGGFIVNMCKQMTQKIKILLSKYIKIHKNELIKSCTCHCKNLLLLLHDKFRLIIFQNSQLLNNTWTLTCNKKRRNNKTRMCKAIWKKCFCYS